MQMIESNHVPYSGTTVRAASIMQRADHKADYYLEWLHW